MEDELQQLRSRATELLLREDWKEYINLYTHIISLCRHHSAAGGADAAKLRKTLCLAFSNRAEGWFRLRDLSGALEDCDDALEIEPAHVKTLVCKGKVLLELDRYSKAADCFQRAIVSNQANGNNEEIRELLGQSRKLELQSKTGTLDLSDWILSGFEGKSPELAEYVGPVEIRRSASGGRGLFATKSIEAGAPLMITKAVVIGRGILPEIKDGSEESARLVMWKDFVDRILDATEKSSRTLYLVYALSSGEEETELDVPDMELFRPEAKEETFLLESRNPDVGRILKILDVNCLTEEAVSARALGKNSGYSGVGLWILPSFVNHSCSPNVRRLHIGDRAVISASRDIKAGDELTIAYFDVLLPLSKRIEMSKRWGFQCSCERCSYEEAGSFGQELRGLEVDLGRGLDPGEVVVKLEEGMKRHMMKKKEKGFLRASLWPAYSSIYNSDRLMRTWGRSIPAGPLVEESVFEAVGGDERVLKMVLGRLEKTGTSDGGSARVAEMEKLMKLGRGTYGKVMKKKQAMRALFDLTLASSVN